MMTAKLVMMCCALLGQPCSITVHEWVNLTLESRYAKAPWKLALATYRILTLLRRLETPVSSANHWLETRLRFMKAMFDALAIASP